MATSSAFSALERNGFTCVYSKKFVDIKMSGEPLVVPEPPHTEFRIYIKDLLETEIDFFMNSQGFKVVLVEEKDSDAVMKFLQRTFFIEEPVKKALGLNTSGICPEYEDFTRKNLQNAVSFKAVDVEGNIVGVVVSALEKQKEDSVQILINIAENCKNEKLKTLIYLFMRREKCYNLWEKYPEEKHIFVVKIAATDPAWRNKGIMTVLLERTEQIVRQKHIRLLKMGTSSAFSANCAERNGFTCVYSIKFADMTINGEPLVVPEPPHTEARIYIKDLLESRTSF